MTRSVALGVGLLVLCGNLFAVAKGGPGERLAGAVSLLAILLGPLLQTFSRYLHVIVSFQTMDTALATIAAVCYLILAISTGSIFLGGAMLCQAFELGTDGMAMIDGLTSDDQLKLISCCDTVAVTIFVVAATVARMVHPHDRSTKQILFPTADFRVSESTLPEGRSLPLKSE